MLYEPFGGSAQTWSSIACYHPAGPHMVTFKQQPPALVAAFVHCCYLMRCHPDIDRESLFSSHSIAQVIDDADESLLQFLRFLKTLVMMFSQLILMSSLSALPPMSLSLAPNGVPTPC
jgi:hypothetical protein